MTQTLKTLIDSVATEVHVLQDTKADRIELNAYVKTVPPENRSVDSSGHPVPQLVSLVTIGNVLIINTHNLRGTLQQIAGDDVTLIDLESFTNNVVMGKDDPFEYLNITSDGQDLHVDNSGLLNLITSKAPGSSLIGYLRTVVNDAGDVSQHRSYNSRRPRSQTVVVMP